jgi:hypothetical protein
MLTSVLMCVCVRSMIPLSITIRVLTFGVEKAAEKRKQFFSFLHLLLRLSWLRNRNGDRV